MQLNVALPFVGGFLALIASNDDPHESGLLNHRQTSHSVSSFVTKLQFVIFATIEKQRDHVAF